MAVTPLTAEQQSLATAYLPLARSIARPFKQSWPAHRDDFESAAGVAIVEAAGTFDPARGVLFSTFARHRVWGALRDVQRSVLALGWRCDPKHAPMLTTLPKNAEGKGRVIGADQADPVGWEFDHIDAVEAILRRLPERNALVMRHIYLHGKNQYETAVALGYSQTRIFYIIKEALAILNGSWAASVLTEVA